MFRVRVAVAAIVAVGAAIGVVVPGSAQTGPADPQVLDAHLLRTYDAPDANQGVAIDRSNFYAVDNTTITKHDRESGDPLLQFAGGPSFIHMDSGAVHKGKLYAAHSNYDARPMVSSLEVFDAKTMRHIDSHSFGIDIGSFTWVDQAPDGTWWGGFANYDAVPDGDTEPYGETVNTQVVRFDGDWQVAQAYTIPNEILDRFRPMSNSGGSWGPDGRLWLTGHDLGEAYVMEPPTAGSELRWIATVRLPGVEGQGISWDLTSRHPTLWAIKRSTKQVLQFDVPWRQIQGQPVDDGQVNGPGQIE
jgi:hypothetical protein